MQNIISVLQKNIKTVPNQNKSWPKLRPSQRQISRKHSNSKHNATGRVSLVPPRHPFFFVSKSRMLANRRLRNLEQVPRMRHHPRSHAITYTWKVHWPWRNTGGEWSRLQKKLALDLCCLIIFFFTVLVVSAETCPARILEHFLRSAAA